jgi:hypothetical protein
MALRDRVADVIGGADPMPDVYRDSEERRRSHLAMADAVITQRDTLFRGDFEQRIANDEVRRMRQTGICPTCGAEEREER